MRVRVERRGREWGRREEKLRKIWRDRERDQDNLRSVIGKGGIERKRERGRERGRERKHLLLKLRLLLRRLGSIHLLLRLLLWIGCGHVSEGVATGGRTA